MTDFAPDVPLGHNYDQDKIITGIWGTGGGTKGQLVKISAAAANNFPTEPTVIITAATGDKALGVALKTGAVGDNVPIMYHGISKLTAAGAITAGAAIKATSSGQALAATTTLPSGATAVTSNAATPVVESGVSCGIALQAPAAAADLFAAIVDGSR